MILVNCNMATLTSGPEEKPLYNSLPPSPQLSYTSEGELDTPKHPRRAAVSPIPEKDTPEDPLASPHPPQPELEPLQPHSHSEPFPAPVPDYDPSIGAKPYSPFYRHATTPSAASAIARFTSQRKRTRSFGIASPIDDLENGSRPPWKRLSDDETRNMSTTNRESKLWAQKKRRFDCLSGLSKKQRIAVKIVIAVVVVGCMVAIALGITAAVGGGVWSGNHRSEQVH